MRWKGRRESENVEDRRYMTPRKAAVGGGAIGIVVLLVGLYMGKDPQTLLRAFQQQQQQRQQAGPQQPVERNPEEDELAQFVSVVLADTEDVWVRLFAESGQTYKKPKLVLFSGKVESACGFASSASGPFYCPGDDKVYIDLKFYQDLKNQFGAPGDCAQAYVIAHEVGHHVQKLLGTLDKVHSFRGEKVEKNKLLVRLELQADFLAGIWAHHARKKNLLEAGDIEEALRAANAIGDDRIQKQAQGYVVPDSFTHGTSEQRSRWFRRGYETGDISQGDTFSATAL